MGSDGLVFIQVPFLVTANDEGNLVSTAIIQVTLLAMKSALVSTALYPMYGMFPLAFIQVPLLAMKSALVAAAIVQVPLPTMKLLQLLSSQR